MSREKQNAGTGVASNNGVIAIASSSVGGSFEDSSGLVDSSIRGPDTCTFCLVAEFDIDKGSTLSHQYPEPVDHDEHMLAELMLPDGVHARSEDWTVFFLPASCARFARTHSGHGRTQSDEAASVALNSVPGEGSAEGTSADHKGERVKEVPLIYVLNLVRTKHDNTVRRGAMVKAIAIGSTHPYIHVFKPALLLALDDYFKTPSIDPLARLYESLNQLDLSAMPVLTRDEKLILRSNERRDLFEERFIKDVRSRSLFGRGRTGSESTVHSYESSRPGEGSSSRPSTGNDSSAPPVSLSNQGRSTPHLPHRPSLASLRQAAGSTSSMLKRRTSHANSQAAENGAGGSGSQPPPTVRRPSGATSSPLPPSSGARSSSAKDTHFWETNVAYGRIQELPLRVPTDSFSEEVGEYSLINLFNTFAGSTPSGPQHPHLHSNGNLTSPIILLFNAVVTGKRIIFLGHNQPASKVAAHVLAACALGSGCGAAWRGVVKRCFPYTNLGMMDELEKTPGYIAGVTNPRFEELHAWDVLLNIETGKITVAKDIEPAPPLRTATRPSGIPDTMSSGSIGSWAGSVGVGPEGEMRVSHRAPSEPDASSNLGHPTSGSTLKGSRERGGTMIESRADAFDNAFVDEIQLSIAARYGERHVRARFIDYALNFVKLVARHEEHYFSHTNLGPPSQPFLNGQLGSGVVRADRETEMRDLAVNAQRIEGFRSTDTYDLLCSDEANRNKSMCITGFDVGHQIVRLRKTKRLASAEADLIFSTLARSIHTSDHVIELLSLLPPHKGGLFPISSGLLASSRTVRSAAQDLLVVIATHSVGKKFIQSLNLFHRLAFARALQDAGDAALYFQQHYPHQNQQQQHQQQQQQQLYLHHNQQQDQQSQISNGNSGHSLSGFHASLSREGLPTQSSGTASPLPFALEGVLPLSASTSDTLAGAHESLLSAGTSGLSVPLGSSASSRAPSPLSTHA